MAFVPDNMLRLKMIESLNLIDGCFHDVDALIKIKQNKEYPMNTNMIRQSVHTLELLITNIQGFNSKNKPNIITLPKSLDVMSLSAFKNRLNARREALSENITVMKKFLDR